MDSTAKVFEIGSYIATIVFFGFTGWIAYRTYREASHILLNVVHSQVQQKMLDRIAEVSEELFKHFHRPPEQMGWLGNLGAAEVAPQLLQAVEDSREEILHDDPFVLMFVNPPDKAKALAALAEKYESDPFIPRKLREAVVAFLKKWSDGIIKAFRLTVVAYAKELAAECPPVMIDAKECEEEIVCRVHNELGKYGVSQLEIQGQLFAIRDAVQHHFDRYDVVSANLRK